MAETNVAHQVTSAVKIEELEHQRCKLARQNAEKDEEIKKLMKEIEGLRSNGEELETQVARLQHDILSEMNAAAEARAELRKVLDERESRIEILEREVKKLKLVNAESEVNVRVLERKLGVVEVKEIEERSKRIRLEEAMKDKVDERGRTIEGFKSKSEELEKWVKEKSSLEEKERIMELSIVEAEKVIRTTKEKNVINGTVNDIHGKLKEMGWPNVLGGTAGLVGLVYSLFVVLSEPGTYSSNLNGNVKKIRF